MTSILSWSTSKYGFPVGNNILVWSAILIAPLEKIQAVNIRGVPRIPTKHCKNEQTLLEYFRERGYFGDNDEHARSAARINIQRFRAKYGIFLATHDIWPVERYDSGK